MRFYAVVLSVLVALSAVSAGYLRSGWYPSSYSSGWAPRSYSSGWYPRSYSSGWYPSYTVRRSYNHGWSPKYSGYASGWNSGWW